MPPCVVLKILMTIMYIYIRLVLKIHILSESIMEMEAWDLLFTSFLLSRNQNFSGDASIIEQSTDKATAK